MRGVKQRRRLMDPAMFNQALQIVRGSGPTYDAARLVLVEGQSVSAACRMVGSSSRSEKQRLRSGPGVQRANAYKAIRRIRDAYENLGVCPSCGQRLPGV